MITVTSFICLKIERDIHCPYDWMFGLIASFSLYVFVTAFAGCLVSFLPNDMDMVRVVRQYYDVVVSLGLHFTVNMCLSTAEAFDGKKLIAGDPSTHPGDVWLPFAYGFLLGYAFWLVVCVYYLHAYGGESGREHLVVVGPYSYVRNPMAKKCF